MNAWKTTILKICLFVNENWEFCILSFLSKKRNIKSFEFFWDDVNKRLRENYVFLTTAWKINQYYTRIVRSIGNQQNNVLQGGGDVIFLKMQMWAFFWIILNSYCKESDLCSDESFLETYSRSEVS